MKTKYAWRPDIPDARDFKFKKTIRRLPTKVDMRHLCTRIENQRNLGSCTANAIAGAMEFLYPLVNISRLFIYYNERDMIGTISEDSGAYIRDGIKSCAKIGACNEKLWPYRIARFKNKPTKRCFKDAENRKIVEYRRCDGLDLTLAALAEGYPVIFGFSVYESFESATVARTGMMPYPNSGEELLGGHAVLAVGYDLATRRLIVRNSWGAQWGKKGYFYMPFKVIENRNMSDDFWMIKR